MAVRADLDIFQGDTYLSRWYAVVIDGLAVDLTVDWTIKAQAKQGGTTILDFGVTDGARVLIEDVTVQVAGLPVTTSALRLYLTAEATDALVELRPMDFDVEISHPTFGPLDDPYRVTLLRGTARVREDVTE